MTALDLLIDGALRDPLDAARTHARAGGRVVGYVGADAPVELIIAAGAYPLRVPGIAEIDTTVVDRYLESTFTADVRSIAALYLRGDLDFLESLILPRSNDSAQRLYYYLCELRSRGLAAGPTPLIFDLAKIPRASSRLHTRWATTRLAEELGVKSESLPGAIGHRNRRREFLKRCAALRAGESGLRGSTADSIFRAADLCEAKSFDAALREWFDATPARARGPRLLLAGSSPPDARLHLTVESAGGNIVAEFGGHPASADQLTLVAGDGSLDAIADHYQANLAGTRAFIDSPATIKARAQSARADGVVVWLTEQEDALNWRLPGEASALRRAGIPTLCLTRRRWDAADGAIEEIMQFTRTLGGAP